MLPLTSIGIGWDRSDRSDRSLTRETDVDGYDNRRRSRRNERVSGDSNTLGGVRVHTQSTRSFVPHIMQMWTIGRRAMPLIFTYLVSQYFKYNLPKRRVKRTRRLLARPLDRSPSPVEVVVAVDLAIPDFVV